LELIAYEAHPESLKLLTNISIQFKENPLAQINASAIKKGMEWHRLTFASATSIKWILKRKGLLKKNPFSCKRGRVPVFPESFGVQQDP